MTLQQLCNVTYEVFTADKDEQARREFDLMLEGELPDINRRRVVEAETQNVGGLMAAFNLPKAGA